MQSGEERSVLGKKLEVLWPHDKRYYPAVVDDYDSDHGRHTIKYDDGTVEMVYLEDEEVSSGVGGGGSGGGGAIVGQWWCSTLTI